MVGEETQGLQAPLVFTTRGAVDAIASRWSRQALGCLVRAFPNWQPQLRYYENEKMSLDGTSKTASHTMSIDFPYLLLPRILHSPSGDLCICRTTHPTFVTTSSLNLASN